MKNKSPKENSKVWSVAHPLNFNKYRGEYIALVNNKIIAHGKDFGEVYKKAIRVNKEPIFTKIPENEVMIL